MGWRGRSDNTLGTQVEPTALQCCLVDLSLGLDIARAVGQGRSMKRVQLRSASRFSARHTTMKGLQAQERPQPSAWKVCHGCDGRLHFLAQWAAATG
jgi:hypothetical protein